MRLLSISHSNSKILSFDASNSNGILLLVSSALNSVTTFESLNLLSPIFPPQSLISCNSKSSIMVFTTRRMGSKAGELVSPFGGMNVWQRRPAHKANEEITETREGCLT